MHRFVLHNDEIRESGDRLLSAGQMGLLAGWGVFSTIRVTSGVLVAFERHWARMQKDAAGLRVPFPEDPEYMRSRLLRLVQANHAENATLRVVVVRNGNGKWAAPQERDFDLIALTADLTDWGAGARLAVEPNARFAASPHAGTKTTSWILNLVYLEQAQARGFDEVLLLNERGEVSECASANIFAAYGTRISTPPLGAGCLPGVTRDLLLSEVRAEGIVVEERTLRPEDLEQADEVFITSVTRDLLPVFSIEGLNLRRQGDSRQRLGEAFRSYVEAYVAGHRGKGVRAV
jgi:branched-subunit amino acid aminotransferase/4-amino-4-deoxychorismate lyase